MHIDMEKFYQASFVGIFSPYIVRKYFHVAMLIFPFFIFADRPIRIFNSVRSYCLKFTY